MAIPFEKRQRVSRNITFLPAGKRIGPRFRLRKDITDIRDERRRYTKTFEVADFDGWEEALEAAEQHRDWVDRNKKDVNWLRQQFADPKKKPREKSILGILGVEGPLAHIEPEPEEVDIPNLTYSEWMELGLRRTRVGWEPEPGARQVGYLHRILTRNSKSDFDQKRAAYLKLEAWGGVSNKRLEDLSLQYFRAFIEYLEADESVSSVDTIWKYAKVFRTSVSKWAQRAKVYDPMSGDLPIKRHRIKAKSKPEKARSAVHAAAIRCALWYRVVNCPRDEWLPNRALAYYVGEVLAHTGLRPGEVLNLALDHIDLNDRTISIRGAVSREGVGDTKVAKQLGRPGRAHRDIPMASWLATVLEEWIARRPDYGFPTISEEPILFPHPEGGWTNDERIRDHFRGASKKAGIQKFLPSWWRATVLTRLAELGCPPEMRKAVVGHELEGIQSHYVSVQAESARPWIEILWDEQGPKKITPRNTPNSRFLGYG